MEANFFYEDKFCSDLSDLMDELDIGEEQLQHLPDGWSVKVELSKDEPMFQLKATDLEEMLYDKHQDRYTEDTPDGPIIVKALNECVDFEKLNSMIPSLYYPSSNFVTITKQDLIDYCA